MAEMHAVELSERHHDARESIGHSVGSPEDLVFQRRPIGWAHLCHGATISWTTYMRLAMLLFRVESKNKLPLTDLDYEPSVPVRSELTAGGGDCLPGCFLRVLVVPDDDLYGIFDTAVLIRYDDRAMVVDYFLACFGAFPER